MGQQYKPQDFFRAIGRGLIQRYFDQLKLSECVRLNERGAIDPNLTIEAIENLKVAQRRRIESDFSLVTEMASDPGSNLIRDEAVFWRLPWASRLDEMKNGLERAFLALLEDRERLDTLASQIEMDRFTDSKWWRRSVGPKLDPADDDDAIDKLKAEIKKVLKPQGRGKRCHVDHCERRDPLRFCYFAYPEDLPKTDPGFDEKDTFGRQARRSALEIIFVYRPESGLLEMAAPGNKAQKEELATAFCSTILQLPNLPLATERPPFTLNILKSRTFEFRTGAADNIERIELRMLRFDLPGHGNRRVTISARPRKQDSPLMIYDVLDDVVNTTRIPLTGLNVSQARISMKFKGEGRSRGKSLTFEVTLPNGCNLKDHAKDLVAKRYLKTWGIAHD